MVAAVDALREPCRQVGLARRMRESQSLRRPALLCSKGRISPRAFDGILEAWDDIVG